MEHGGALPVLLNAGVPSQGHHSVTEVLLDEILN